MNPGSAGHGVCSKSIMRYQIRLMDQNLPGLARELAMACWRAVDAIVPERVGIGVYRSLCRAVRRVLKGRVQAFRYCGAARVCEYSLPMKELERTPGHESYPAEHMHVYLTGPEMPPEELYGDLLRGTLRAVVSRLPDRRLKGVADLLRNRIEKTLEGRIFKSDHCGDLSLCDANEPYDPWDLTDPINLVSRTV
jgi:hypothetical protein